MSRKGRRKPGAKSRGPDRAPRAMSERSIANLRRGGPITPMNALRHGGYASVAVEALDAKTRVIYDTLAADAPLRDGDGELPRHDSVQVRLLADVLCRLDSVGAWLAGRWATQDAGPVLELESRLRKEASGYLIELGMTPRSRAALGIDVVRAERSWSDALADGREAVAARMERDRLAAESTIEEESTP